jgi:hypothetical protein
MAIDEMRWKKNKRKHCKRNEKKRKEKKDDKEGENAVIDM